MALKPSSKNHVHRVDYTVSEDDAPILGLTMDKQYQKPTDKPVKDYAARLNKGGWQFWNAEKTSDNRLRIEYRPSGV